MAFSQVGRDLQARIDALYAGIAYGSAQLSGLSGLADRIIHHLAEDGVDGKVVLEIGCADGTLLERLAGLGAQVRGIEPGALAAARCVEKGIPVEQRPFHPDRPMDGPACDVIILRNIIEHTPDPVSWLRRLGNALQPSGRLFLETPNASWFARKGDWSLLSFLHPVLFSPRGLTLACARAGLTARVIDADGPALLVEATPAAPITVVLPEAEALPALDCSPRIEAVARVLAAWRDAGLPFFVWGAGTFAGGLLAAVPAMAAAVQCHAGAMTFPEPVAYLHDPLRISPIPPIPCRNGW
ncbi:class I SAM-dependent methyltransferase (plasmid) [Azospirillum sp. HJ39]|uniref:class I SAM-dependent methyltransferase n=1 Tax=Azospirillum sp. HJ39 TaxID=3159496 RepID=UPI003558AC89